MLRTVYFDGEVTMSDHERFAGIDVSKEHLDLGLSDSVDLVRFPNTELGISELVQSSTQPRSDWLSGDSRGKPSPGCDARSLWLASCDPTPANAP